MQEANFLYQLTLEDFQDTNTLKHIYSNKIHNYYVSFDFSEEFYIAQAKAGFIATSIFIDNHFLLLPEIQFEYAVLNFQDLHISKKVEKILKKENYKFYIDRNIDLVLENLNLYHKDNWLIKEYEILIKKLFEMQRYDFSIKTFELYDDNDFLVAAEVGYKINNTYTSLSGFSSKEKIHRDFGKAQMVLTARYLEKNGYHFWNLGHPFMQYKFDLGAKKFSRDEFLKLWYKSI